MKYIKIEAIKKLQILFYLVGMMLVSNAQDYPKMVGVEGGTFVMGDVKKIGAVNERPAHKVTVNSFAISETEITVKQYRLFCEMTGNIMPEEPYWEWNDNFPITSVTWEDAVKYTHWLSEQLNKKIRLPYEAEWEYAARGGNKSKSYVYSGSDILSEVAWFEDNAEEQAHAVAAKKANELGLYDMSGNVWEWCLDTYDKDYYAKSSSKNPKGGDKGDRKTLRGGAWFYKPTYCRSTFRSNSTPDYISFVFGFRIVEER